MTLFVLYHPLAGNGRAGQLVATIQQAYPQLTYRLYPTEKAGTEKDLVAAILAYFSPETDQFLVIGGDGTLSKTLAVWPATFPLAYLPAGSGNDFARSLGGLPMETVMAALLSSQSRPITVLKSPQGQVVVNSFDVAYAAQTVALTETSPLKTWLNQLGLGRLIYVIFGLVALFRTPLARLLVTLDGQVHDLDQLFFCSVANNTYFGGGVTIWPTSHVTKSYLCLVYAKDRGFFGNVQTLLSLLFNRHEKIPRLQHLKGQSIQITAASPLLAQIDGESCQVRELTLTCQQRQLFY